jgi:hypothetical protein
MPQQPTPFALSQLFSQLIGRRATFVQASIAADTKIEQIYGVYNVLPGNTAIVVKADLPLLGSFAGLLVGLPDAAVTERLGVKPIEELLRDAIYEVLNIASAVVTEEGRAVLGKMVYNPTYIDGDAGKVFNKPDHRSYFNVTVDGYRGGKFAIFSAFSAVLGAQ